MRICSPKPDLTSKIQIAMSGRTISCLDCLVLDGCAILWVVQWPSNTNNQKVTAKDCIDSFESYILHRLEDTDIYLVVDKLL